MIYTDTSKSIIKEGIGELCDEFLNNYACGGPKAKSIVKKCKNNYFSKSLGVSYTITSALSRSVDSSLGNKIQLIAIKLAQAHGFGVVSDDPRKDSFICELYGAMSKETEDYISQISNDIEREGIKNFDIEKIRNNIFNTVSDTFEKPIKVVSDLALSRTLLNGKTEVSLLELKMGGNLDKGKANSTRRESFEIFAVACSKYRNGILNGDTIIVPYFATAYNKDDEKGGYETWKVSSIKTRFDRSELLINRDFWNFIFNDENGFKFFYFTFMDEMQELKTIIEKIEKRIVNESLNIN